MSEPAGPLASPGFWLHHAALVWRQEVDTRLKPVGLTPTQFSILASTSWLTDQQGPPTQQQVAEQSGADRMMTSRIVAALEFRGLLVRHDDDHDARAKRLAVTAAGKRLVLRAVRILAGIDEDFFGTGTERQELRDRLQAIAARRFETEK
jgi:DNA-binding MarR family transcriptional regulator